MTALMLTETTKAVRNSPQPARSWSRQAPVNLRAGQPADADALAMVSGVRHAVLSWLLSHRGFYSAVAEAGGEIAGGIFLDERSTFAGIRPIAIDPRAENGLERRLLQHVLDRAADRGFQGTRLVQGVDDASSLELAGELGFEVRESLAHMQGAAIGTPTIGYRVRPASEADVDAAMRLSRRVLGHYRGHELRDGIEDRTAVVVEREGRMTGYATALTVCGNAVAETTDDLQALIAAVPRSEDTGILVPVRNSQLFRWALGRGMRVVETMTLISTGVYREPVGAYLPSISY